MYSITTLSGGEQILLGQKKEIIDAISLAVGFANTHVCESEHIKKIHAMSVYKVKKGDTLAPMNAVAEVSVWFSTVAKSNKSFWIVE